MYVKLEVVNQLYQYSYPPNTGIILNDKMLLLILFTLILCYFVLQIFNDIAVSILYPVQ